MSQNPKQNDGVREFELIFDENADNPCVRVISKQVRVFPNESILLIETSAYQALEKKCKEEFDIATGYHKRWQAAEEKLHVAEQRIKELEEFLDK